MRLIKNYGFLWERALVEFGRPGVAGSLCGYSSSHEEVDFREQIGIYVLYSDQERPVYVGQSGKGKKTIFGRLKDHKGDHLWNRWKYFSWFGLRAVNKDGTLSKQMGSRKVDPNEALNEIEAVLIQIVEPRLNKQGGIWKDVEQFSQLYERGRDIETVLANQQKIVERLDELSKRVK